MLLLAPEEDLKEGTLARAKGSLYRNFVLFPLVEAITLATGEDEKHQSKNGDPVLLIVKGRAYLLLCEEDACAKSN